MEDNTKDVLNALNGAPESSTEIQDNSVHREVATPEPEAQQQIERSVPEVSNEPAMEPGIAPSNGDVDDMGVSYYNRYREAERKRAKLEEKIDKLVELQQQAQQPKQQYSIEQLEAFSDNTEDPNHKAWAKSEIRKIQQSEQKGMIQQILEERENKYREEQLRSRSFQSVINRNPELVIKDNAGNFIGWNDKSPLKQRIDAYMRNPRIASQPDAIEIAEAFAYRDLMRVQRPAVNQKLDEQSKEIKSLQKQTLIEGSGSNNFANVNPVKAAIEKGRTGKITDNKDAMASILKRSGIIRS